MSITFDQYIANPMQKQGAVFSAIAREAQRKDYTTRFNNILLRENGRINFYLYKNKERNEYYIHIKIPSEPIKKFYYDVVLKFYADSSVKDLGRSLNKFNVQFFSNDPAFVFTFAYVFNKNNLLVKELQSKMSTKAIKTAAKEKNPENIIGYVKSLFFAYLFMSNRGLFSILQWNDAEDFDKEKLLSRVTDADTMIDKRQAEGKKLDRHKKLVLDKQTTDTLVKKYKIGDKARDRIVTTTSKTPTVKKTKSTNSTKRITGKGKKSK
jgi:hypothetical protein